MRSRPGDLTGQPTAPEGHVVQGHSTPAGGVSGGREGHLKRARSLGSQAELRPSSLPPPCDRPRLTLKSPWMRPVGTTSSCQPGTQGPELRHRVSVSTPWVSSSRSSATPAVGRPRHLRPRDPSPCPVAAAPCPRTPARPVLGAPSRLCGSSPSFPGPSPRDPHLQRPRGTRGSAHRRGLPHAGLGSAGLRWPPLSHGVCQQPRTSLAGPRGQETGREAQRGGLVWRPAQASPRSVPRVWSERGPGPSGAAPARSRSQL